MTIVYNDNTKLNPNDFFNCKWNNNPQYTPPIDVPKININEPIKDKLDLTASINKEPAKDKNLALKIFAGLAVAAGIIIAAVKLHKKPEFKNIEQTFEETIPSVVADIKQTPVKIEQEIKVGGNDLIKREQREALRKAKSLRDQRGVLDSMSTEEYNAWQKTGLSNLEGIECKRRLKFGPAELKTRINAEFSIAKKYEDILKKQLEKLEITPEEKGKAQKLINGELSVDIKEIEEQLPSMQTDLDSLTNILKNRINKLEYSEIKDKDNELMKMNEVAKIQRSHLARDIQSLLKLSHGNKSFEKFETTLNEFLEKLGFQISWEKPVKALLAKEFNFCNNAEIGTVIRPCIKRGQEIIHKGELL